MNKTPAWEPVVVAAVEYAGAIENSNAWSVCDGHAELEILGAIESVAEEKFLNAVRTLNKGEFE